MKIRFFTIVIVSLFITSCGSKRKVAKSTPPKKEVVTPTPEGINPEPINEVEIKPIKTYDDVKKDYIEKYQHAAIQEMQIYKIPASITLAQGILESRSGKSELTLRSNNHFGIKCHKGWKGRKTYHDDDEKGECFRAYEDPSNSFRDHSLFLALRKRYADLFTLKITDYKGWARGLRKAGYATDKAYPQKLIKIIEDYELYKYDAQALGKSVEDIKVHEVEIPEVQENSYIVQKGDTLYSISRRYNISVDQLKRLNSLQDNTISVGQKLIVTSL